MKFYLTTCLILLLAMQLSAQAKCELVLGEAPTLQHLKLGMTETETRRAIGLKVKAGETGQSTFFKNYIKSKAKRNLTGVRALYLRFYNERLYQIEFFYEPDYRWQNLENLLDDYSAKNNFPREFWESKYGYASADCAGFSLKANYQLNPHIQLTDKRIAEIVKSERKK